MTIQTFPTLTRMAAPRSIEWRIEANTQTFTSPLSGSVQTLELPGARWGVSFVFEDLPEADSVKLETFLAKMRGQAGRCYLYHFARPTPRGVATGTPLVKGANQTGNTLVTDGWSNSITGILLAGDFFGVNGELKQLVEDANSNGSGEATLVFESPLRAKPADNAALTTSKPTSVFRLTSSMSKWSVKPGLFSDFTFDFIEQF